MNLSKLIHEIWKDPRIKKLRVKKEVVKVVVEVAIDHIVKGLLKHGQIKLQNLFTLDIRKAKGRKIANPRTGEPMEISSYYKVGLEPSKRLKDGLKKYKK